ncbi:MAG TPA: hypothetical protein PKH77_20725 [Anaerolineae bacterium]|nr:hypothetical protein [Anaerolineae bacterium]
MIRRSNLFWGSVLLAIGGLLLLENLGLLDFLGVSVWSLILPLGLIGLGIWVLWSSSHPQAAFETEELSFPLEGTEEAHVSLDFGAGEVILSGQPAPGVLLSGTFDGVTSELTHEGGRTRLTLKTPPIVGWPISIGPGYRRRWSFSVSDAVPVSLTVHSGASDNRLDLRALKVRSLRLESGASSTHVTLPENAGYTEVRGSGGAASITLHVPEGVAAHIHAGGAIASVSVNQARFPRVADGYQSPDYAAAANKVDIHLDMGVGSISIS